MKQSDARGTVPVDPRRYHESVARDRTEIADRAPVCLYLEVTNRCNLLCTTCPRTYEELEPPADMSWELFTSIVDQVPDLARAVLHGVGEPMLVANLPRMVKYLKDRGTYVLFNTNGTVLSERNGRALIDSGLDELRVSLDAANRESFKAIRGRDYFGDFDPFGDFDLIFGASKLSLKSVDLPIRYAARSYGETQISRFRHGVMLLRMVVFAFFRIKAQ